MMVLMSTIGLADYLGVSALLLIAGLACMILKRNILGVLMGVELILNAANLNLAAFARFTSLGLDGQMIALFVIVLAAAEAAIALAIALSFYNSHDSVDIERGQQLKG